MRAADPVALGAWYRDCLGLDADENGLWRQGAGPTVFATFESETDYFGSRAQQTMLDFQDRDLDAMLAQLRAKGADVAGRRGRWRASVDSAGSPIPRAIGSSCGSPPEAAASRRPCQRRPPNSQSWISTSEKAPSPVRSSAISASTASRSGA